MSSVGDGLTAYLGKYQVALTQQLAWSLANGDFAAASNIQAGLKVFSQVGNATDNIIRL